MADILKHTFTLADGSTEEVAAGCDLPSGLSPEFPVVLLPEDFVAGLDPVFVCTTVGEIRELSQTMKNDHAQLLSCLYGTTKCIEDLMPVLDDTYARAHRGDATAKQLWSDFCNDVAILASARLSLGHTLRVLLERPAITEGIAFGKCFTMKDC